MYRVALHAIFSFVNMG